MENPIKSGDYAIIQRQDYTKLHKLKENGTISLGALNVELRNVIGHKYYELFRMKPKGNSKKFYTLEKTEQMEAVDITNDKSAKDNRDLISDGASQTLSKEEIENLRSELNSTEILEKLVANSKTFELKTEYSQEKYIKKKEKKYFDYIRVRKPTIRLIVQMFHRQDPHKILGIRIDDLSQILTYSGVQSEGDFVLYDSGTSGLVTAALLERIGPNTNGKLVHVHPGNECQKTAVVAMQFPDELLKRCIDVNLYSVLRWYHQKLGENKLEANTNEVSNISNEVSNISNIHNEVSTEVINTIVSEVSNTIKSEVNNTIESEVSNSMDSNEVSRKRKLDTPDELPKKKPCWHFKNDEACEILRQQIDGLVVVSKEHPVAIVKELSEFLRLSRPLVVFNLMREPLLDLYSYLKERGDFVNIQLVNNFMRQYQVLPERTHPLVNMNSGGFILYAFKVNAVGLKL